MRIVIDSNIIFSALIRDSENRRIILNYDSSFLFPSFIFEEIHKYKELLLKKSGMNSQEFEILLSLILEKVEIITEDKLIPHRQKALEIVKDIDQKDAVFFACALAYNGSIIWSNDKNLKKQTVVKVLDTSEIKSII